jgi:hypothetical protein
MMASKRQTQANQKNAQLSTGPTTPEGKAVCAANAITHGFSAQATLLPSESSAEFHAFLDAFQDEFQPQTALERSLVRHLADADWRLRRAATFETAVLLQRFERVRQFTEKHPNELPENPDLDQICVLGAALIHDAADSDPLSKISRHETRLARRYFKSLARMFHKGSKREASEARGYKAHEAWRAEAYLNSTVSTASERNAVDAGLSRLASDPL